MRISSFFPLCLVPFTRALSLNLAFANVAFCNHWNDIMRAPCLEMLESMAEHETVTVLVPYSDAAKRFRESTAFAGYTNDSLCDLVKYHTIVGDLNSRDLATGPPFLETFLGKTNSRDGYALQVQQVAELDRRGRGINFYSGLRRKASMHFADYDADGIHIHFIDEVLTPPLSFAETAHAAGLTSAVMAATKANLDWWTDYPATYFIPKNDAFQNVGSALNDASDEELRSILTYHYLNRTRDPIFTSSMHDGNVATGNGEHISIARKEDGTISVNSATITQHNIIVQNGVLHVIDQVLNPNNNESRHENTSPFGMPTFPNATRIGKPPFADMLTKKTKYHLEPGQQARAIPYGQS